MAQPKKVRSPRCKTCGKTIRLNGWSIGAAVRRHYWRNHPEIMRPKGAR